MEQRHNIFDSLVDSGRDAFSFKNLMKRILQFVFFGIILSIRDFIPALDQASKQGNLMAIIKAFTTSIWSGIGTALSSLWALITQYKLYTSNMAIGSIFWGIIMGIAVFGFFYQPISLLVNFFDGQGRKEAGNYSGNATGFLVRAGITLFIVLILSAISYNFGLSENILSDFSDNNENVQSQTNQTINESYNQTINDEELINSLNMLIGDTT